MEEKTKYQIEKEKAEKRAIEKENKILRIVFPVVGVAAFIIGLLGFILTVNAGKPGMTVFFIIMTLLGLVGVLYGVLLLVRIKKPDFLKKKKPEEVQDEVLPD
ncbi:MAG: hypothetical protein J6N95_07700 [Bacilli bacterium]|nr:hypothetical protein [Bacilli bacterium]